MKARADGVREKEAGGALRVPPVGREPLGGRETSSEGTAPLRTIPNSEGCLGGVAEGDRGVTTLRPQAPTEDGAPFKRSLLRGEDSGIYFAEGTESRDPSRRDCGEAEETAGARGARQDVRFRTHSA